MTLTANELRPTPYPDVNAVLALLLENVREVLGDDFTGLYLHGSLACGDFAPARSDVDFLVATQGELPPAMLPLLRAMHARVRASGLKWAEKLEGSYIPLRALRRYQPPAIHPALRTDGSFEPDGHGSDWIIQRWVLRERGIALAGPPLRELIDPISPEDLRRAQLATLREWWSPPFPSPQRFESREYQAYAALTMCRALYTLRFAEVVSKPAASCWALETLDPRWRGLIERALAWPRPPQPDELEGTMGFIRYALEQSAEKNPPSPPLPRGAGIHTGALP